VSGVIEQFSGYHRLENVSLTEVKRRLLRPTEYWGGGNGVAVHTQIIKQADTVLLLHLFADRYPAAIRRANWEHYEPRTEHGSSLSACVYALAAANLGKIEWAYRYFLKTATIDLTGESKQYVGTLYIGGTHPAANGGAWMAAVLGFGGLDCTPEIGPRLYPRLPAAWRRLAFLFAWRRNWFSTEITPERVTVTADVTNSGAVEIDLAGESRTCAPGATVSGSWTMSPLS
jgi:kojibiose phosphorylase